MSRISSGYVRQILLRAALLASVAAGMLVYAVVQERWGLSTSFSDALHAASKLGMVAVAVLAASFGFVFAFVLAPCIAIALGARRGHKLWLLSNREARRFGPDQVMSLRISGAHPETSMEFGALYTDTTLDGPWLKRVFRNTALVTMPLPFAPFAIHVGSVQTVAIWVVGTGMLCMVLLALWYEASKLPSPGRLQLERQRRERLQQP